ncbi:efflux RND transporter periplasmic adaptor subunit [Alteromonas sp. CYL-A6]|uniref:efflux RND transporter periplasmic adaptor subunit n=1 Tax=Alteromonas nitratireducens TaxID=3390813 RepID=UPI0034B62034
MRALLFCIFTLGCLTACDSQQSDVSRLRSVMATTVSAFDGQQQHKLSGVTQSAETSQLSFEVAGIVNTVKVNLGDEIQKGQLLATIDDKVFSLAVKQRQGALSEVLARLEEARRDYRRKQQLRESGAVSEAELDIASTQLTALEDQVDIARAQLALAQEELDDTRLVAPYPGRIAGRFIEPSQRITPAQPAFSIEGSSGIEVSVAVPENLVNKIHPGDEVDITVFALDGKTLTGQVFEVGSRAQSANAFPVTITLDNPPKGLQPGMSAEVTFFYAETAVKAGFEVPLSALTSTNNHQHVIWELQAVDDPSRSLPVYRVISHPVEVVSLETDVARINGPLKEGMHIVRQGGEYLQPEQHVHLANGSPRLFNE